MKKTNTPTKKNLNTKNEIDAVIDRLSFLSRMVKGETLGEDAAFERAWDEIKGIEKILLSRRAESEMHALSQVLMSTRRVEQCINWMEGALSFQDKQEPISIDREAFFSSCNEMGEAYRGLISAFDFLKLGKAFDENYGIRIQTFIEKEPPLFSPLER